MFNHTTLENIAILSCKPHSLMFEYVVRIFKSMSMLLLSRYIWAFVSKSARDADLVSMQYAQNWEKEGMRCDGRGGNERE